MTTARVSKAFLTLLENDPEKSRKKFETEDDIKKIISSLTMVERLYPDQVLMLCRRSHPKFSYVGSNCAKIFGYSGAEFQSWGVQEFFKNIHTEDLPGLQNCSNSYRMRRLMIPSLIDLFCIIVSKAKVDPSFTLEMKK